MSQSAEINQFLDLSDACDLCGHGEHDGEDCEAVTGYSHINGDEECGCPGSLAGLRAQAWDESAEEAHALGWLHDDALSDVLARNPYRVTPAEKTGESDD